MKKKKKNKNNVFKNATKVTPFFLNYILAFEPPVNKIQKNLITTANRLKI